MGSLSCYGMKQVSRYNGWTMPRSSGKAMGSSHYLSGIRVSSQGLHVTLHM